MAEGLRTTGGITTPVEFMGVAGSPYTRKMRALLRYRGIPYRMIGGGQAAAGNRPQPRVRLLPTFYLPDANGDTVAVTDSTPLTSIGTRQSASGSKDRVGNPL